MISYKVKNIINSPAISDIKVGGYFGRLMDTMFSERALSDYAMTVIYREAEDAFVNKIDDKTCAGTWQGEFWGKWMISACRIAKYTGSESLRSFILSACESMMKLQRDDGYLGTYKNSRRFFAPSYEQSMRECGRYLDWNWNIWCRKYTLWGMLEAYMLTLDDRLLASSRGMADSLISDLAAVGAEPGETGSFKGLASSSVLKPMLILYRLTEDEKYLNFATRVADRWQNADIMPGIIANSMTDKRIREWYPDSNKWAKAYEMMSCFDGILELYRISGNKIYLEATSRFFDMIIRHERNHLGSVAFNDVFGDAAYDVNTISEPCDVIHLIRLAHELFALTGDHKYMDVVEDAGYNALLAAVCKDGKWGARGLRGAGRHLVAFGQAKMKYHHCCVNNMPRGLLNLAESALMLGVDGRLYVNTYSEICAAFKLCDEDIRVEISGDYLADGRATIKVYGIKGKIALRLRVPTWAENGVFKVGEERIYAHAPYVDITLDSSQSTVEAEFPWHLRIDRVSTHPERGDLAWKEQRWVQTCDETVPELRCTPADPETFIRGERYIMHIGPTLLCRSKLCGAEQIGVVPLIDESYKCTSIERVKQDGINIAFDLVLESGKDKVKLRVCDYASGTNVISDDKHLFSIYF